MRKNKTSLLLQTRVLHLENLEKREMLSVSPLDAPAAQEAAAESSVVDQVVEPIAITLNAEAAADVVTIESTGVTGRFNATWSPMEGYETYHVKLSRDGGETWSTYRKGVAETTIEIQGIYAGNDYIVRVYGENAKGYPVASTLVEGLVSPVSVTASLKTFNLGDTISAEVKAGESASYSIEWYIVTSEGDVAIPEASGQTEYTPTDGDATIKVVVTGDGVSAGTSGEATIKSAALTSSVRVAYDSVTHKGVLSWTDVYTATKYRVQISRDGGETWATYGALTTDTTATVNGLYVGHSYVFRVTAYNDVNKPLTKKTSEFAPVGLTSDTGVYSVGETITVSLKGTENVDANIRWYYVTDDGDVEIEDAAFATSYMPETADYPVRIVATGINASLGSSAELVVSVSEELNLGNFSDYKTNSRSVDVNWDVLDDAASYVVYKNTGSGWVKATKVVVENGAVVSGAATISADGQTMSYRVNMIDVEATVGVRVVAYDASGAAVARESTSYSPFGVVLNAETYVAGSVLEASTLALDDVYSVEWYADGVSVSTSSSLTVDATLAAYASLTVVVTDLETGNTSAATAYAKAYDAPEAISAEYDETSSVLSVTFTAIAGQTDLAAYQIQYYNDSVEYPVWLDLQFSEIVDNGDGTVTVSRSTSNSFADRFFRVRTVGETGASNWRVFDYEAPENFVVDSGSYDFGLSAWMLNWDSVDGAVSYTLVATVNGEEQAPITIDGSKNVYAYECSYYLDSSFTLTATSADGDSATAFAATDRLPIYLQDYDASTRVGTLSWDAIPGASSYRVLKSTNGGESWTTYATTTSTTQSTRGLYLGKSYLYRVEALDAKKFTMATVRDGEIAPITLTGSAAEYGDGDTLSVTLKGVAGVTAVYEWYYVIDGEYVWIDDAFGLSSYTFDEAGYEVFVYATANQSDLATATVTFAPKSVSAPTDVTAAYDADENAYVVSWTDQANETGYFVSATITTADGDVVDFGEALDADATSYTFDNVSAGATYEVVVIAQNSAGEASADPISFATALVSLNQSEFTLNDVLSASLSSDAAEATYKWSVLAGETWVDTGITGAEFTITSAYVGRSVRVDAVGAGVSAGSASYAVANPYAPTTPENVTLDFDAETEVLTVSWDAAPDAYQYLFTVNEESIYLGKGKLSMGLYIDPAVVYEISVAAVNASGVSEAAEVSFANLSVELSEILFTYGDCIDAIVTPEYADVTYAWYSLNSEGEWVSLEYDGPSLSIDEYIAGRSVKVVAETSGYTLNTSAEAIAEPVLPDSTDIYTVYDNDQKTIELSWDFIADATGYVLEYYTIDAYEASEIVTLSFDRDVNQEVIDFSGFYEDSVIYFSLYAVNEAGMSTATSAMFAAANVELDATEFSAGDTITASLNLLDASAEYTWYYYVDDDWTEVPGGFCSGDTVTIDSILVGRTIKVVASGYDASEGSSSEATIYPVAPEEAGNVSLVYDQDAGSLTVTWDSSDNAYEYIISVVIVDENGDETSDSVTIEADEDHEYVMDAWSDYRYTISVAAKNDTDVVVGDEVVFAPANVSLTDYFYCGDTIYASLSFEEASAEYAWYYQDDDEEWVAIDNEGAELVISEEIAGRNIRVDATGTDASEGSCSTAYASPAEASALEGIIVTSTSQSADLIEASGVGNLVYIMWNANADALRYVVERYDDGDWTVVYEGTNQYYCEENIDGYSDLVYRVAGVNAASAREYTEIMVPFLSVDFTSERFVPGEDLTATLTIEGEPTLVKWYACEGSETTEIEGANSLTITPPEVESLILTVSMTDGETYSYQTRWQIQGVPRETPSAVVTTAEDVVDPFDDQISLREAVAYISAGKTSTSEITFDSELDGSSIALDAPISIADGQTITIDGDSAITLDSSDSGSLFSVTKGSLTVCNLDVVGGSSTAPVFSATGSNSALNITNVSITAVQTTANGVVMASSNANLVVDRASFSANSGAGSMIYVDAASSTVANSLFVDNSAVTSGSLMIVNSTTGTSNYAYNLTVMDNTLTASSGAGLYIKDSTNVYAYNMLLTGNSRAGGTSMDYSVYGLSSQAYLYNFCFGSYSVEKVGTSRRFNEVRRGSLDDNYVPTADSSYVDAGNATYYGDYDLAGNARVSGNAVDIGAYERQQTSDAVVDEAFADLFDELFIEE